MTSPKPVTGLSASEASRILTEVGTNELALAPAASSVALFVRQFASPVICLLLGAGVVSVVLGEVLDAGAILAIVVINAIIGFVQEFRAQRAVQSLRSMTAPRARVMRNGNSVMVLALVLDPPEQDVLMRPPRSPEESMLGRVQWRFIVLTGVLQAAVTLSVYLWALETRDLPEARNLAFSVLVFGELFRAFSARSADKLLSEVGAFTNLRLLVVVVVSIILQYTLHHLALAQRVLEIAPLSWRDCALTIGAGLVPFTIIEVAKLLRRARLRRRDSLVTA